METTSEMEFKWTTEWKQIEGAANEECWERRAKWGKKTLRAALIKTTPAEGDPTYRMGIYHVIKQFLPISMSAPVTFKDTDACKVEVEAEMAACITEAGKIAERFAAGDFSDVEQMLEPKTVHLHTDPKNPQDVN